MITTVVELAASYLMEWLYGSWMWDYTRFAWNFDGRIALNPSIRFGIGGMVFLYLLQPVLEAAADRMPPSVRKAAAYILAAVLLADMVYTFIFR